ncbi:DUF2917 domain-containing protein [bacterium]|nr:MAG: DUF2917 domain-containing protein [bacterium]
MKYEVNPMTESLEIGEVKSVDMRRGEKLRCETGTLWLTFDGEGRDIILREGDIWAAPKNGRAVVQALTAGSFSDLEPRWRTTRGDAHFMPRSAIHRSLIGSRG